MNGRAYLGYVARLPCAICVLLGYLDPQPQSHAVSHAHHPRTGVGAARRAADEDAYPLCPPHHQNSNDAYHVLGRKAFEKKYGVTDAELTADARKRVQEMIAMEV